MTTELRSFDEAAAIAIAEFEEATLNAAEASLPEAEAEASTEDGQAETEPVEQTDSQTDTEPVDEHETVDGDDVEESLFSELEIEETPDEPTVSDDTKFELPGVEGQVTLQELKDGYQRQADYTRKTQQVADVRKQNEKAIGFWDALQANPEAVVRQLAAQVGLIEEGAAAVKAVEFSPITSSEAMEAEIAQRVVTQVAEHPSVIGAQRQEAFALIDSEFDRIGVEAGVTISEADRQVVLQEASRRGVADLDLVFTSLMAQREKATRERAVLKEAAPARPTGSTSSEGQVAPAASFEEAAERALLELGMTAD